MATDGKMKKDEVVEALARRLARLPKADLVATTEAIESGALDLEKVLREARQLAGEPPFGFQRRLKETAEQATEE